MLDLTDVTGDDVVYDLGSGDGRIPLLAAERYRATAVGLEIQPSLVQQARKKASLVGVEDKVEFRQEDFFEADLRDATVVTVYLLPETNEELGPVLLEQLDPRTRVVSRGFGIGDWVPDQSTRADEVPLYLWTIPCVDRP
jgi:predicted RNA methylase